MATTDSPDERASEYCPACDAETPHHVSIDIRNQSGDSVPDDCRAYGRSPYRVANCHECGHTQATRVSHWES